MIEVNHLTKRYGEYTAVSDLSLHIQKGQIYGFLGPNGAGKSTTMNIMTGCLAATAGSVKIGGYDIFEQPEKAKRLIGYLPEQPPLYQDRTVREYLTFVGHAKGLSKADLTLQMENVMAMTQTTHVADRLIKNLSKGYKQRVGIAQALLGDPEVIILDEPTVGLDPRQIIEMRDLIRSLGTKHTVLLSSHILSEVQSICQTILIISKGHLVACDTPENLEKLFAGTTHVELTAEGTQEQVLAILATVEHLLNIEIQRSENGACSLLLETDGDPSVCRSLFFAFSKANCALTQMRTTQISLEDIFIELTADNPLPATEGEKENAQIQDDTTQTAAAAAASPDADSAAANHSEKGESE